MEISALQKAFAVERQKNLTARNKSFLRKAEDRRHKKETNVLKAGRETEGREESGRELEKKWKQKYLWDESGNTKEQCQT